MTIYNFSHLVATETVKVKQPASGKTLFTAVVREITQGDKAEAQRAMFKNVSLDTGGSKTQLKRSINSALNSVMQSGEMLTISELEEVAAIESWTLKDADGNEVPVCVEAWRALPASLASQIEEVIERLNPSLDDDTKSKT